MGILDRQKEKMVKNTSEDNISEVQDSNSNLQSSTNLELGVEELEFVIRLIGNSNFKGNNLMFIYDLVKKLQDEYLKKSGGGK